METSDLVTAQEIAERFGSTRPQLVHDWRRRHPDFPAPVVQRPRAILWSWREVERWARATGRL